MLVINYLNAPAPAAPASTVAVSIANGVRVAGAYGGAMRARGSCIAQNIEYDALIRRLFCACARAGRGHSQVIANCMGFAGVRNGAARRLNM